MIDRDELMKMCGQDAPEPDTWAEEEASARKEICGEISLEGYRFCKLDPNHSGPHAYESYRYKSGSLTKDIKTKTGLVLHCAKCQNPLITNINGCWCDICCKEL